jgi:NADH pyrophosphatase NudC (nudix superfamily)
MEVVQSFAGNNLNRSVGEKKSEGFLEEILALDSTKIVIVSTNKRGVKTILCLKTNPTLVTLAKISVVILKDLFGFSSIDELASRQKSLMTHDFITLGQEPEPGNGWLLAVAFPGLDSDLLSQLSSGNDFSYSFEAGRNLLLAMPPGSSDLAIAGQALSMASWHDENRFCSKTGQPTEPIEAGLKRRSLVSHRRVYPRIDPVAIALVWSPDRTSFLLGNMKRSPSPQFYSCLSGFVEPCESIEETVCREVFEESGVVIEISSVQILKSQPWPIGRTGGCELMIGCSCIASTTEIQIHDDDVREVRWFPREEIEEMLRFSSENPQAMMDPSLSRPVLPGPYAIAHQLLRHGVAQSGDTGRGGRGGEGEVNATAR